jgi:hypothetical protein
VQGLAPACGEWSEPRDFAVESAMPKNLPPDVQGQIADAAKGNTASRPADITQQPTDWKYDETQGPRKINQAPEPDRNRVEPIAPKPEEPKR